MGCGTRGEARVRNRAGLLWAEPLSARTLATLGTSEAGRRGGFSASSPKLRWSQGVSAAALVKTPGPPPEPPPGASGPPRSTGVAVAFTLERDRRFSRDSSGLARRPMERPSTGAMVPGRSSKSAMCRRVRCDARWRGRRDAGSKPRRRAPRAAGSAAGVLTSVGVRRRGLAVLIVAECTARFHLVDVLSSLTDEARASGDARGAVRRRRWEKRHARNVTAMKNARANRGARNPTPIIRRGEMRCGKRLLRVSCQTRPCHARGDGASSPRERGSERSAAIPGRGPESRGSL
jgi:hypothetical protein